MDEYCKVAKRKIHVVNLDPAAEHFSYDVAFDIRDLISLEDVAEELKLGPNGGLIFCMQYLVEHIEWLEDKLSEFSRDDVYIMFDCPGQIELYTHLPIMSRIATSLQRWGYRVGCAWMVDSTFITDVSKFLSGSLIALSAMVHLELPHINVLTKSDLVSRKKITDDDEEDERDKADPFDSFKCPCASELAARLTSETGEKFQKLNESMAQVLDEFSLVGYVPMSIKDTDSISLVMLHLDNAVQYGEDVEPKSIERMQSAMDNAAS